uniref:Uncharacterized protein n=1 Tax=Medicago truncatula TaxID=3880 RepID=I3T948_MEDTR|nr:unknown [Medicago truncatula]
MEKEEVEIEHQLLNFLHQILVVELHVHILHIEHHNTHGLKNNNSINNHRLIKRILLNLFKPFLRPRVQEYGD